MSHKSQKGRKLNSAISFMLTLAMVVTMLPLFSVETKAAAPSDIQQQTDIVWSKLSKTGTPGTTLGSAGTTSYYYVDGNTSYNAGSSAAGTSGLIIKGTVYLYIPFGVTLTCVGAPGNKTAPGGAGIEVSEGNTLYILGAGTLSATGGKAGDGSDGGAGGSASADSLVKNNGGSATLKSGYGGAGGAGGGGAGAGIGTKGAVGASGGNQLNGISQYNKDPNSIYVNSNKPNNGAKANAPDNAGNIYKSSTVTINATGGTIGAGGKAGGAGKGWLDCGSGWKGYYSAGAGGGGGGGGAGYAAAAIGNGGYSGAGGGSGVNGGVCGSTAVSYCLRNGAGGTGGAGGADGATAKYQTSRSLNTGFSTCSGGTNDAAVNKLTIECWGLASNGTIGHGTTTGGKSGAAGAAGTGKEPTYTSYNYSVKFITATGETIAQTDYLFAARTLTTPTSISNDKAIQLRGWKLVNYGNTLSGNADPLTTAESEMYPTGATILLSNLTYGNITLQAVTDVDYTVAFEEAGESNFIPEQLNNKFENKNGGGLAQSISGTDPASDVKVVLINSTDNVSLYKIADISWDYLSSIECKLTWNKTVAQWLGSSKYADSDIVANPLLISDMTSSLEKEFFADLLSGENNAIKGMTPAYTNSDATIKGATDDEGLCYTRFKNVPAGMYAVTAGDSNSPVVVTIMPYQNGPSDGWYLDSEYVATLKHSNVNVNKKINGNDIADTVAYNDVVTFAVDFNIPSFKADYADRVTLTGNGSDQTIKYTLKAVDTMSPAFSLINTDDNKPTLTCSFKQSEGATLSDAEVEAITRAFSEKVDYYEFADETYTGTKTKVDDSTLYAVSKSDYLYEIGEPSVADDGTTTLTVNFNVPALKAFAKDKNLNMNEFIMTLQYQATVTNKLEIGSDANTNKIVLSYEDTPSHVIPVEDVVYGDSYGLQVIKINGTDSTEETKKYLSGAKFMLYKEVDERPEDMSNVYEYNDRYFVAVTNIFTDNASNLTADGVFTSVDSEQGIILKGLKEGRYILAETSAPIGFNELAEDIYFEINKLSPAEAESHHAGRYKIFKEMDQPDQDTSYNESGMISVSVLNYKGLTLPSTGGAGTLLFTIIGIIIMMSVVIILVLRRRACSAADYM